MREDAVGKLAHPTQLNNYRNRAFNGASPWSIEFLRREADRRGAAKLAAASVFVAVAFLPATPTRLFAQPAPRSGETSACAGDNGGITLSPGFCATIFADNIGHARQMVFGSNGVLYVNTWSGHYYRKDKPPPGGFLVGLKDSTGSGRADVVERFGDGVAQGSAGGTGIAIYNGGLYAEQNDKIIRYPLPTDAVAPKGSPQVIVSGLPLTGDHPMHPFIIDADAHIYRRPRLGYECLPGREPHAQLARPSALHRA